jgi:hypothetical protein
MRQKSALYALVLCLVCAGVARPQAVGTIVGAITDPSGASVPAAQITLTQTETGAVHSVTADALGYYLAPALRPARYELAVTATGFRGFRQTDIVLQADQTLTLNVRLQVGSSSESISVSAEAPQVDTYTPTLKQVVDEKRMVELPLNGRNAASLTTLVAGVVEDHGSGNDADQGSTKTFPTAVTISTNGSRQNQVSFLLDGGNNVDQFTNVNMPFPFPDALQEFSVQTSNYSAQFGQNAGGVVNVVTKSGTNELHASAFEFNRNAVFNARNSFTSDRDQLKRNQFGGTFGGPVVIPHLYNGKDHTFFFVGSQGTTIRNVSGSNGAFAPTAANLNGDFSSLLNANDPYNNTGQVQQLIDPSTGKNFPGNLIPVSQFDPAAVNLMKYLPRGTAPGLTYFPTQNQQNFYEVLGRVDQSIGDSDRLFVRYFGDHFTKAASYTGNNLLTDSAGSQIFSQNYSLGEIHTFRPNLLNNFNFTYGRVYSKRGPAQNVPSVADLGVNIYQPAEYVGIEYINARGYFSLGTTMPANFTRNTFNFSDNVTWIRDRHNFTFGGDVTRARLDINNFYQTAGDFYFTGDRTGDGLADLLLGRVRWVVQGNGQYGRNRNSYAGFYAQDSWRASRRLVLDFGVRWDPWWPVKELKNKVVQFNPQAYFEGRRSTVYTDAPAGEFFPGDTGFVENGLHSSMNQIAPRVGFAWDVMGDGRTSLRGGSGVFYDSRSVMTTNWEMLGNSPYSLLMVLTDPAGGFSNPLSGAPSPFPAAYPPAKDAVFPRPVQVVAYDPTGRYKVPTTYQWNLTLERQFAMGWLVRTAYVGSHTSHLRESVNLNPAVYIPGSDLGTTDRRMFKDYNNIFVGSQDVNSRYNSLQVTFEKRFSHGFSVLGNYIWSKSIDDMPYAAGVTSVGGDNAAALPWYDPNFHRFERGPSEFDHTHMFVVSSVWELPKLTRANPLLRGVAGGWQVSGIGTARTGNALTLLAGTDRSQTALGMDRVDYLGGTKYTSGACVNAAPCQNWLNAAAFGEPATGSFGNTSKGGFRGPGAWNIDMGIFKTFGITERTKLQVRGEFFNILNHVNLGDPGTGLGGGFGQIYGADDPRISQLAMKLSF